MSPPEFSIICRTHGGPVTTVRWELPNNDVVNVDPDRVADYTNYEASTVVIDTSHNCVYESRLRVRGKYVGNYNYTLFIKNYLPPMNNVSGVLNVSGKKIFF